ncbi:MAG: Na(+)-translocating NADH-quinone reductase subunit A [Culturomica sp.]|jgi:Na+-transporting NADH:ubiquinone oxidoreductase subunit A|nr:Na(+)-translocating NADH-quinone reductase subunit A [Culturomica sp.]
MSKVIKLKKGLDIKLKGEAEKVIHKDSVSALYAVSPDDFKTLLPKLSVKVGDVVKAGDALFTDKVNPDIRFVSPVSGVVYAINRGDRRKLLEVVVKSDAVIKYKEFSKEDVSSLSREAIIQRMLEGGVWAYVVQRPYGIVANPAVMPKAVFVSTFDSAPLAPDFDFVLRDQIKNIQTGLDCLKKLCGRDVNLNLRKGENTSFAKLKNVEINYFDGPHPCGNVGVQIHHLNPVNKGECVWTVNIQDVAIIGRLFNEGRYDASKIIALTGSEVEQPCYYKVISGAQIYSVIKGNLKNKVHQRIISGNVLTGRKVGEDNYLGFYANQITVIPEGDDPEFLGWAMPGLDKFSASKLFPSFLMPWKHYDLDANLHGERRAFVVSGQYEKVFPMDIYPVYLLKAALAKDIDQMEGLGIYEVIPEDMALCEFVCTSKNPVQQILQDGIELMIKETN